MRRAAVGVGLIGLFLGIVLWPGPAPWLLIGPDGPPRHGLAAAVFWALILAGVLGLLRNRAARVAGAAVALPGLALLVAVAWSALGSGLPAPGTGVLVAGGAVTGLAVVVGAVVPDGRGATRAWWHAPVAAAVAVAVVAGGAVGFDGLGSRAAVTTTTAAPGGPPAPVPAQPGVPRWTWRHASAAHTVLAAGQGVVAALGDGSVVGLDGRGGTPRWSFRRAGARVEIQVSPDRATVVALHIAGSGEGRSRGAWLTVLDADTGARRWDGAAGAGEDAGEPVRTVTDRVLVTSDGTTAQRWSSGALRLVARSLTDGREVWSAARDGCETSSYPISSAGVAAVLWRCPGDDADVLEGLDEVTGVRRWQVGVREMAGSTGAAESYLEASRDGRSLVVVGTGADATGNRYATPAFRAVLDPLTGAVRGRVDDVAIALSPGRPVAYGVMVGELVEDPLRPEVAVGPTGVVPLPGGCGPLDELTVVATDAITLRLCHDRSTASPPLLQVDGRAPSPVGLDVLGVPDDGDTGLSNSSVVDPRHVPAFTIPAPGAYVVGASQRSGTVLVGLA